ncbi:MAG: YceI family protein [Pseudomonadota bacterium]
MKSLKFASLAAALTLGASTFAIAAGHGGLTIPSGTYAADATHSNVTWKVSHFGLSNYTGQFNAMNGTLELNAEDPTASKVSATVDISTISTPYVVTGDKDFDVELQSAQWFAAEEFPQATFESTSLELGENGTGTMTGDMTFRGQTVPMTFDVSLNGQMEKHPFAPGAAVGFTATGTMDRTAFGFDTFAPNVGAEVELTIQAEFIEQK